MAQRVESTRKNQQTTGKFNRASDMVKDNASNFLAQMEKIPYNNNNCWSSSTTTGMTFHVWTDVPTTVESAGCNQNSKNHHVVIAEENASKLGQKRTLNHISDSTCTLSKKRHSSPLKSNVDDDDQHHDEDEVMQSLAVANTTTTTTTTTTTGTFLCRNHFYKGKCAYLKLRSEKKHANCRHEHPVLGKDFKALGDILNQNHQSGVLDAAEAAMVEVTRDETKKDFGGMEMLHYFSIKLHEEVKEVANNDQQTFGQVFTKALRDCSCIDAGLVYIACDHTLIFDRYQEGLLLTDLGSLLGEAKRSASVTEVSHGDDWARADCLPVAALENILMYLPDASTAAMSRVCSAWHNEIENSSCSIWQHMLKRRNWPLANDPVSSFKMHYEVVRDVAAVKDALATLLTARQASASDNAEMEYQPFSTRHTPPSEPNSCVAMEVWSPGEVIAAFSPDCTIRLFKTIADGPTGGKTCREVISVCVNPFPNTSKRKDQLVAMAFDSRRIGCLLDVDGDSPSFLSIISRDAFHKTAGGDSSSTAKAAGGDSSTSECSEGEDGVLAVIDVREGVLDYISANDDLTYSWQEVHEFDSDDFYEIKVIVSDTLVACGYGLFAVEADLCIDRRVPIAEEDDDDDCDDVEISGVTLDRMIVVICATKECVAWMGALPLLHEISDYCEVSLAGSFIHRGQTTSYCLIVGASSSLCLSQAEINGSLNDVCEGMHLFDASPGVSPEFGVSTQRGRWKIDQSVRRCIVLYPGQCVVTVDVFENHENYFHSFPSSCVSFFPCDDFVQPVVRENALDASSNKPLWLKNCHVLHVQRIREEHILLICEQVDVVDDSTTNDHDVVESGRGSLMAEKPRKYMQGLVLHVPTRQVIDRILFPFDMTAEARRGLVMCSGNSTIGVGLSGEGIILTGADIRAVGSGAIEL